MRLTRQQIAARVADDIPDGAYVNLGIGVPTLVADYLPDDRQIVLHTENGMLGMGHAAAPDEIDDDLINAGKIYVTEELGAAYFHHADSFAMMRGGHIDYCVMGGYQVSVAGDLANWRTNSVTSIPGVGGAMDLAAGAKHVYVLMDLFTKAGECKLVQQCTYPLTGAECVERVYSDVGVFELADGEVRVLDLFDDELGIEGLAAIVGSPLVDARLAVS
ncbi:MAG: 3-oxoadipate CoA-transferase [Subtercola sp.]|jgi:3-oxoadipate CoA-transferase beta subunit|nr:3-oxoadipate CoA-transferase [Subtercola sp.]